MKTSIHEAKFFRKNSFTLPILSFIFTTGLFAFTLILTFSYLAKTDLFANGSDFAYIWNLNPILTFGTFGFYCLSILFTFSMWAFSLHFMVRYYCFLERTSYTTRLGLIIVFILTTLSIATSVIWSTPIATGRIYLGLIMSPLDYIALGIILWYHNKLVALVNNRKTTIELRTTPYYNMSDEGSFNLNLYNQIDFLDPNAAFTFILNFAAQDRLTPYEKDIISQCITPHLHTFKPWETVDISVIKEGMRERIIDIDLIEDSPYQVMKQISSNTRLTSINNPTINQQELPQQ